MNRVAAERALVALETCNNSLARLAMLNHLYNSPACVLNNADLDKLKKLAGKKFPSCNLTGQKGYEQFRSFAKQISLDFHNHWATFIELPDRMQTVKDAIIGIFQAWPNVKFQTEPGLVALMMNLFVAYVKVHAYVCSMEYKEFITMFGAAHETNLKILPNNYDKLVDWINNITKLGSPFHTIHDELSAELAPRLTLILKSIKPVMNQFPSAVQPDKMQICFENMMKNDFTPLHDVDSLTMPATKLSYQNFIYYESMVQWILYGYLVVPEALETEDEIHNLLIETLNQTYLLPVYQDVTIDIHDEFQNLIKWWPEKKSKYKLPATLKLSKFQKLFPDSERAAIISCGALHSARRCFLRTTLANLVKLFSTQPGLLAPQFPMILSAMSLSRFEVMWYFHHLERPPTGKSTSFFGGNTLDGYDKDTYKDMKVTALVSSLYELNQLVLQNTTVIQKYYVEYLKGCHRTQLANLVKSAGGAPTVAANCASLVEALGSLNERHDLRSLRLDWFRGILSDNMKLDSIIPLVKRMNTIYSASLYVDSLQEMLVDFCSLKDLWWYMNTKVEGVFQGCVNFSTGDPQYCFSLLYVINDASNNIVKSCPEEQFLIGEEILKKADGLLAFLSRNIATRAYEFARMLIALEEQGSPIQAAYRMDLISRARALNKAAPDEIRPGFESKPENAYQIINIHGSSRSLTGMCASMGRANDVQVYTRIYCPAQYLQDTLKDFIKDYLRINSFTPSASPSGQIESLERPSVILNQLKHLCSVMHVIDAHVEIGVGDIIRQVLFSETHHPILSVPGLISPVESSAYDLVAERRILSDMIAVWFTNFIDGLSKEPGSVPGVSYSAPRNAFVKWNPSSPKIQAELYIDVVELRALCEVIGTSGFRVVDAHLIRLIFQTCKKIKELLVMNTKEIDLFKENWSTNNCFAYAKQFHNLMYLNRDLTIVGNALALRRLLHDAAGDVSKYRSKAVRTCLNDALQSHEYKTVWENVRQSDTSRDTAFTGVGVAAYDIGIPVGLNDHKLSCALLSLNTTLWGALPYAVAASFIDEASWNNAEFKPDIDVHNNNVHVMAIALEEIIRTFIAFEGVNNPRGPIEAVKHKMHEFVRVAVYVLLQMKEQEKKMFPSFPIRAMFIFLEMVVTECEKFGTCDRHEMEKIFPYSLVHAAYVDISLGKQRTGDEPSTAAWDDAGLREEMAAAAATT